MPKAKIRHGLAFYMDEDDNQQTAWRGQVVNLSQEEYDRLDKFGALLPVDAELPVHGKMTPIPNMASDEELLAWVSVATKAEIEAAIAERPAIADRLQAAQDEVQKKLEAQNELLSGLKGTIAAGKRKAKKRAASATKETTAQKAKAKAQQAEASSDEADGEEEEEELDEDDPREVIKGTVDEVSAFLAEHPEAADDILAAEQEAATNDDREVRKGVEEAARLAKSNTQ